MLAGLCGLGLGGGLALGQAVPPQQGQPPRPPEGPASPQEGAGPRPGAAEGEAPPAEELIEDTVFLPVSRFVLFYFQERDGQPSLEELSGVEVELERTAAGFERPGRGGEPVRISLGDVFEEGPKFSASALVRVTDAVRDELEARGLRAIFVIVDPQDVNEQGEDLREGRTPLRIAVFTGAVSSLRTVGSGARVGDEGRFNNPMHERVLRRSPLVEGDLIRGDTLDRYVFRLNRHPGRRVDVALAPGGENADELAVDYLIYEPKPWTLYGQISNTGTQFTDEWRERFGFIHNQLTGRDDILRLDYLTAGFDESHTVIASYEFPMLDGQLRVRPYGSYQEYTASDVGFAGEQFEGTSWQAGLEGAWNVFQRRASFIDLVGGFRWEDVKVRNALAGQEGNDDFFILYGGARFERFTDRSGTLASVILEGNLADLAGTDPAEIEKMGRTDVDEDFLVLKYDLEHSFFLEPVLFREAWRGNVAVDPALGRARGQTLAHELAMSLRGQEALGSRLIPNFQTVLGGLYSVRGYDESLAPGDSSTVASLEYRFHVPRALAVDAQPSRTVFGEPFRVRPTGPYGVTDWDLILKGFFDVGRVRNTDANTAAGERDQTLASVGVGMQVEFRQNLRLRVDWGFVLKDAESGNRTNEQGDHRVHFEGTLFY